MNVVVHIDGREAVPVRAIPFLTQWEVMSPDDVASALSDDEDFRLGAFVGLRAFRVVGAQPVEIPPLYWDNFVSRQLQSISDSIKKSQVTHATGYYSEWREAAVKALPPDAFVWKDEYEPRFNRAFSKSNFGGFVKNGQSFSGDMIRQRIKECFSYSPFLAAPYESLILESLLSVEALRHEPEHTGVCDLIWSEAQAFLGDKFSPQQFRSGWPVALEPSRLGNLQFPMEGVASQDMGAINRANGRQHWVMEALTGLCQRGELKCKPIQHVRRDAGTGDVVLQWRDYLIEPDPFLEWLAKQGLEPSRFIIAWCGANGVKTSTKEAHDQLDPLQPLQIGAPIAVTAPTREQRQAERWQRCVDAGLPMPTDTYAHLPRGVGRIAKELGITRQSLQQELNAHRERLFGK